MRKKKKKKFNFLKFIIFCLVIYLGVNLIIFILNLPIRNIYILNEKYLTEDEVIELAEIEDYNSFFLSSKYFMKKKIKDNLYVKDVEIKKNYLKRKIYIYVEEYKFLFIDSVNNQTVYNNGYVDEVFSFNLPRLVNEVSDLYYDDFLSILDSLDESVLNKISEIKYAPTDIDDKLFILSMNDGNYVYASLDYLSNMNSYLDMYDSFELQKGILYLDSGTYFEIKE